MFRGCGQKHRAVKDMTGQCFNKLTVIERADDYINKNGTKDVRWLCRCDCGRKTIVRGAALRNGHTKSCGICARSISNMGKGQRDLTGRVFGKCYEPVEYFGG